MIEDFLPVVRGACAVADTERCHRRYHHHQRSWHPPSRQVLPIITVSCRVLSPPRPRAASMPRRYGGTSGRHDQRGNRAGIKPGTQARARPSVRDARRQRQGSNLRRHPAVRNSGRLPLRAHRAPAEHDCASATSFTLLEPETERRRRSRRPSRPPRCCPPLRASPRSRTAPRP
jgi:hypothetical protein